MVVTQREIGFPRRLVHPALEDLEDQRAGLLAELALEHLEPLERRSLQRIEPVMLEHTRDRVERGLAATHVVREKVPGA